MLNTKKACKHAVARILLAKGASFAFVCQTLRDIFGTSLSNNTLHEYYTQSPNLTECNDIVQKEITQLQFKIEEYQIYIKKLQLLLEK